MGLERLEPLGRREAVHNGGRAQIEQLGRNRGLLGGNEDACCQVSLQSDGREESLCQSLALDGARHVFVRLVESHNAADLGLLLQKETETDGKERTGSRVCDARTRQVDNGQLTGLIKQIC